MKQFYSTGLRLLSWTALCAGVITSSCKKDDSNNGGGGGEPTPPPVTLNDQIEYNGGDLIDIKSAVYAVDEENANLYTFYLSPTEGLETVKQMEAADDYLKVMVEEPAGTVDTQAQLFSIDYADISVSKTSMVGYANVNLSVNLLEQTSRLVLYVDVKTENGKTLLARYNNTCTLYELPTLNNQYGIDDQATKIGSVVEYVDFTDGTTTYYVYEQEGVTAPSEETPAGLTIQLDSDFDPKQIVNGRLVAGSKLEIDFSTDDMQKVSVQSGTFQSASGMAGTLTLLKDPTDISKLTVKLDIKGADQRLRANYYGTVNPAYKSSDHLKVSVTDDAVMDGDLTELFNYFQTGVHQFAFGIPATDPEEPKEGVAALTTGRYAVHINVAEANLGKTLDLSKSGEVGLFVYDYETYKTYDASKMVVTGTVRVIDAGSNNYYLSVDAVFQDGPTVKGEWFGSVTAENSAFAEILTPVEPYSPTIVVRKEDGTELLRRTLERVEVRMEKDYKYNGGPQWGGAQFDAYYFYFVPEGALEYNDIESQYAVPQFMIPGSFIPTPGESLNLGADTDAENLHWYFKYTAESYLQYGYNGYTCADGYGLTPNTASVSIAKNETDNTWKITFILADYGTNSYGAEAGSKNVITIDWEGPLTKYSGTKKNDLEDSFYGN